MWKGLLVLRVHIFALADTPELDIICLHSLDSVVLRDYLKSRRTSYTGKYKKCQILFFSEIYLLTKGAESKGRVIIQCV